MTILKRTLAFLCASLLCLNFAACNSGSETGETKDTAPAVETNAPDTAEDTETAAPETTPPETEPQETKPAPVELDPLPAADALAAMSDEEYFGSYFRPVIRFVAASDVHIDDSNSEAEDERLANLYKTAYAYSDAHESYKALDAVFFAGDFTNYGTLSSMKKFAKIVAKNDQDYTITRVSLGNHEFYNGDVTTTVPNLKEALGYEDDDTHVVIEGYHFIMVSADGEGNGYSAEKQTWLAKELEAAAADDPTGKKPIFVFQHHHITNTVLGSINWGVTDLTDILKKYPQVVDFSGHSHFPMNDPRSVWQGDFTALGTGTLSYYECDLVGVQTANVFPKNNKGAIGTGRASRDAAQYYIVEVDANNAIKVQGYDLLSGTFMMDPIYFRSVGDPSKFTYTDARADAAEAPAFAADAKIDIINLNRMRVAVEFPQAQGGEQVQNYRVELYQGDSLLKRDYRLACNFYFPAPEKLEASFDSLTALTEYTIKIFAVSCWGKESEPISVTFTTPEEAVVAATGDLPQPDVFSIEFKTDGEAIDKVSETVLDYNGTPTTEYSDTLERYIGIFDGQTDYLYTDFFNFYETVNTAITLETYVRLDEASGSYVNPFANFEQGGFGFEYQCGQGIMQFAARINGSYQYIGTKKINFGEWYHYAATYDGEKLKFYVNGILNDEVEVPGVIEMPQASEYLCVGADSSPDYMSAAHMTGAIASANIYTKALTESEIAALYLSYPGADLAAEVEKMEEEAAAAVKVAAPAYTGALPAPDVLSVEFKEDGSAVDAVSGTTLEALGTPKTEYSEQYGKYVGVFDGASNYKFNEFKNFYEKIAQSVTFETVLKYDEYTGSYVNSVSNMQGGGFGIETNNTGEMQFYISIDGTYHHPSGYIDLGQDIHFVGTYDGQTIKCYINGVLQEEEACIGSITFPSNENAQYMSIGADSSSDGTGEAYHKGTVATTNVYSTVFDASMVSALYGKYKISQADIAAAEVPAADVLSVEFKEDGSAVDAVSGTVLEALGTPAVEFSEQYDRYIGVFDGASNYKFNEFKNFYEKIAQSVTFEVVLKYDEYTGGYVNPVSNMQGGGFGIETNDTGESQFYISINGSYHHPAGYINLGEDIHFVGTYDGQTIKCYINGFLVEEEACEGSITFPSNEAAQYMSIGADSSSGGTGEAYHKGTVSAVNIYSTVLDEVQVVKLAQSWGK
ncbi:MAG: metallophosphoesterase [Clostridia bacterium]|nr:metallophosphoesterase [Clostridia bacterium]